MREFKFRAWEFNKMYYQVRAGGMFDREATAPETWTGSNWVNLTGGEHTKVMQYIGEEDKKGTEIYEDDLVLYLNKTYQIVFYEGAFLLKELFSKCTIYIKHEYIRWYKVEKIGNIYEARNAINKKLL